MQIRTLRWLALSGVMALAAACGGGGSSADNLLASIEEEGVLTVSTDPAYPPQSSLNESTHEMGFAREVGTTMAFFHEGQIVEMGWPRDVIGNPQHAQTKQFLSAVL